jgi:hypothetical protein
MTTAHTATPQYEIKHNEPEGWAIAFIVTNKGREERTFRFLDSAEAYIADQNERAALTKAKGDAA